MNKLEKLIGTKQKVYYPWEQKSIERVIRKDEKGYYINYKGKKVGCRPQLNSFGEVIGFEALKYDGRWQGD